MAFIAIDPNGDRWQAETAGLRLRHLERMPLDASYPDVVARVETHLEVPEIKDGEQCGETDVVLDVTGSGQAILELFERAEIKPIVVLITGAGVLEDEVDDVWRVPKVELVGALRVLYEARRLRMARDLELVPTLLGELRDFKMRPSRIDPTDPESWRETAFDDLVLAVALACWRANRNVPTPKVKRDWWDSEKDRNKGGVWAG